MNAVEIGPIPASERTQSPLDLFLIFAGANVVATTLVSGASLVPAFGTREVLLLIGVGSLAGAALVAALAPLGPRLGVPSVIAARAPLGIRGAGILALLLYLTNFAWIALNNVIAASACARSLGGAGHERIWAVALGILATAVAAGGPRAVGLADRIAVPLMALTGLALTVRCLGLPAAVLAAPGDGGMSWLRGLDVVIGYQVSWILMFADYSRYTASPSRGAAAVFLGLGLTSLWFMPLGAVAARATGTSDPGPMVAGVGLGVAGAALLGLGTLTTNFVNIYLSSLAFKSLVPRASDRVSVWSIGLLGAALSAVSQGVLGRFADFMLLLGSLLVPVGGLFLAHFFLLPREDDVAGLYDPAGRYVYVRGFHVQAMVAWAAGATVYFVAAPIGGTLPALAVTVSVYALLGRRA